MRTELEGSFREFAAANLPGLRRFAVALTGDWHHGDDLVQQAMERLYVVWPRIQHVADPGAYARTAVHRLAISAARRPWWRRERAHAEVPDVPIADGAVAWVERMDLIEALRGLTAKQRAVLVLRHLEDRPVAEVAQILGISQGTVKRQCHDALARLRDRLEPGHDAAEPSAVGRVPAEPVPAEPVPAGPVPAGPVPAGPVPAGGTVAGRAVVESVASGAAAGSSPARARG